MAPEWISAGAAVAAVVVSVIALLLNRSKGGNKQ